MSSIYFTPWVGSRYRSRGFLGKRVLVLGESHYKWEPEAKMVPSLTRECVEGQVNGDYTMAFWTNIAITFLNRRPSLEDKKEFWNSVAFYNYVQHYVAGPGESPTEAMFSDSADPFWEVLKELKPQFILVLGKRLWDHLPSEGHAGPRIRGARRTETWIYPIGRQQTLAYSTIHPSRGYSGWDWHRPVIQALKKA